ncbi:MAG: protein translocase subunit SecD [Thermodesulfobacteriota bacterium]|nr:protein translocase subunit SecD [Thermodesulfobacteriota bacterium]
MKRNDTLKNLQWKQVAIFVAIAVAVILVLPTINPSWWPHKTINLGLDLQGGMHLVLEVETEKAVEARISNLARELRNGVRENRIRHATIDARGTRLMTMVRGKSNIEEFNKLLDNDFSHLEKEPLSDELNTQELALSLPEKRMAEIKHMAVQQALQTIRNRIDEFGVNEPSIRIQGKRRILVQLPGVTDTQRAKDLIGRTAQLEFRLVDEEHDVQDALDGNVPQDSEILYQVKTSEQAGETRRIPFLIKKETPLTGADLADARVQIDSRYNEPYVSIEFNRKGAQIFAQLTEKNIKKRLAIVLDNKVYSAPVIQDRITGGSAQITGNFTDAEARDLAIVLRAGSLPAPVKILEERTVGPSLGKDSIQKGLMSMAIGGIIVILFMAVYYKWAGIVADFALLANILLIAAGLAAFQATLTLPGIAGVILTIGMAVDANVIIFERVREELRVGKTARAALAAGFDRATLTVLDANVTTLIAALVLFQFGTGPVKGFAVTLSLGVLASLFTALIVARQIFDYFLITRKVKRLSI